jgi:hypothetical protein
MVYFGFYSFRELLKLAHIFMSILDHGNLWFQRTSSAQGMYGTGAAATRLLCGPLLIQNVRKSRVLALRPRSVRAQPLRGCYGPVTGKKRTEQDEAPTPYYCLNASNARWGYGLQPSFTLMSSRQNILS